MSMRILVKKTMAVAVSAAILAGCSTAHVESSIARDKDAIAAQQQAVEAMKVRSVVERRQAAKLAGTETLIKQEQPLPAAFNAKFTYISIPMPLSSILGDISSRTGYPVRLMSDDSSATQVAMPIMPVGSPGVVPSYAGTVDTNAFPVDWSGSLKGLLDHLALKTGMYWKYQDGEIRFFKTETRIYTVNLPQGTRKLRSTVGLNGVSTAGGAAGGAQPTGGSGGSSAAAVTVNLDNEYEVDAFDAIRKGVESILGVTSPSGATGGAQPGGIPQGGGAPAAGSGKVMANPALGTLVVTATPPQHDKVEEYVRAINERFAQNVLIDIKVYNVDVSSGVNAGASILAAYQQAAGKYTLGTTPNPMLAPSSGTPGLLVFDYTALSSRWLGSQITLQALSSLGDVTLRTSGQVLAANGQPTPLQVANEITYLASSSTNVTGTGSTVTTTLTPGTKTVGLTANFLPMVLSDNRILLQYQITLSSLLGIDQIGSGGNLIQTPRVATQSLQQQTYVRDGQAIVLFGFEQDRNEMKRDVGIGSASKNAENKRSMMVIVMEVYSGK